MKTSSHRAGFVSAFVRFVTAVTMASSSAQAANIVDFDAIQNWVGTGSNRAALVVDWVPSPSATSSISLYWGYRWNSGTPSASDMIVAVAGEVRALDNGGAITSNGADSGFFFKTDFNGGVFTGIGYDLDGDGWGGISSNTSQDNAFALDAGDIYHEGWFGGFWSYWESVDNTSWTLSNLGAGSHQLSDGAVGGFKWDPTFSSFSNPTNLSFMPQDAVLSPFAAIPEPRILPLMVLAGGIIWLLWRRRRGLTGMACALGVFAWCVSPAAFGAVAAIEVVDYTPGSGATLTTAIAALGEPSRHNNPGDPFFPNVLSPFSPNFRPADIVQLGQGGSITLRLDRFALVDLSPGTFELGIFENIGLIDTSFPNGVAGNLSSGGTFGGGDPVVLEVSDDGVNFVSMGSVTPYMFANGWQDVGPFSPVDGLIPSDFGQAYTGSLANFSGMNYGQILAELAGSGGGTWYNLDGSGLSQVGWVRLSGVAGTVFDLDAVTVNNNHVGPQTVPEPGAGWLLAAVLTTILAWRRRFPTNTPPVRFRK